MNIGEPKRTIEIEPVSEPVPETLPVETPAAPVPEPVPAQRRLSADPVGAFLR
jgi:hypothetical protein